MRPSLSPVPAELTEPQADALRELTNIAAGHAARALSTLLGGEKFGLWPPLVRLVDAPQLTALLGGKGTRLTSVSAELRGDVSGSLAMVFTEPHVQTLTSRLLGAAGQRFQTPEVALRDAANLVYAAALDAVVRLCGVRALHSVPVVGEGPAEMIARMCIPEQRGWVLEAEVYASPLSGRFLLLPDAPGLSTFLRGLKMA